MVFGTARKETLIDNDVIEATIEIHNRIGIFTNCRNAIPVAKISKKTRIETL